MADDLQGAAVKYLLSKSDVVAATGKFTITNKPFIFRDEMLVNLEDGEYQAVSAIVIQDGGPITLPGLTRYRCRRLRVIIWANGTRDNLGNLVDPKSVKLKLNDTFLTVDKYLNRVEPQMVPWGDIYTISSDRVSDLSEPVSIIDGDGIQTATAVYAICF